MPERWTSRTDRPIGRAVDAAPAGYAAVTRALARR